MWSNRSRRCAAPIPATAMTTTIMVITIMTITGTTTTGTIITTAMTTGMASEMPLAACRVIRTMATTMPDGRSEAAQLRLMAFLSPAFPVGGFSYSHGLERAAHDGMLPDADALREWLADLVAFGSGWNDTVL